MSRFSDYYTLTKPGIIYGNAVTVAGGYFLAARNHFYPGTLLAILVGSSLIMACACVCNNYMDRDIDALMKRTKNRPSVTGLISERNAYLFAAILGTLGTVTLLLFTNLLTALIGLFGLFAYVVLYGISKRRSPLGTIIGSISGAIPPVAGYTAVTNHVDAAAIIIFLILVFWQMPHFYAIAMYRFDDYAAAKIPVLPVKKGMQTTRIQIVLYIIGFILASALLTLFHYTGYTYLIVMLALGFAWLGMGLRGFTADSEKLWARKMFRFSLIIIVAVSVMFSVGALLW